MNPIGWLITLVLLLIVVRGQRLGARGVPRAAALVFLVAVGVVPVHMAVAYRMGGLNGMSIGAALNATATGAAIWALGANRLKQASEVERTALVGAVLLIASANVWLMGLLLGPPALASAEVNRFRYQALLAGVLIAAAGFAVLTALREAGDRIFSSLGWAGFLISTMLFVDFARGHEFTVALRERVAASAELGKAWEPYLKYLAAIFSLNAPLVYVAAAAYAAALKRVRWIGNTSAHFIIGVTLTAALLVANGILLLPLAVPAIPYTFPYWLGVLVVARIGNELRIRAQSGGETPTMPAAVQPPRLSPEWLRS